MFKDIFLFLKIPGASVLIRGYAYRCCVGVVAGRTVGVRKACDGRLHMLTTTIGVGTSGALDWLRAGLHGGV